MANSLYKQYGQPQINPQMAQAKQAFRQFQKTVSGDPQQIVMQALQSGQISQADLNRAQEMARGMGWLLNN